MTAQPTIDAPTSHLTTTNIDGLLRHVLQRIDASRATPASVRAALAAAGIRASEPWCETWLQKAAEIRKETKR